MKKSENDTTRITATLPKDMMMQIAYWSNKKGISMNRYLYEALESFIKWEGSDHSVPTQEIERVNQCADAIEDLSSAVYDMQRTIDSGFDALISVTRGDNYFLRDDNGDIDAIVTETGKIKKSKRG